MKRSLFSAFLVAITMFSVSFNPTGIEANSNAYQQGAVDFVKRSNHGSQRFKLINAKTDQLQKTHVRYRQTVDGFPVWGGEAIVHINEDGSVESITDNFKKSVSATTELRLTPEQAERNAEKSVRGSKRFSSEPITDLWIYRSKRGDRVAYRVQFERIDGTKETAMPVRFVDAENGEILFEYDNFQTAMGGSQYSGNVLFNTASYRKTNYLEDLNRMIGTFDYANSSFGGSPSGRFTDSDNNWFSGGNQTAAVDAHWGAAQVYDYYRTTFGRIGIDGSGGPTLNTSITSKRKKLITSGVHYATDFVNAGWTGSFMLYGDGDGVQASALTTLDIVGHEFTHGVTQSEAGLIYSGESGALNEGISDIFGALIEARAYGLSDDTWKIGEKCWTPSISGDALRYMDEPHRASNNGFTIDDDPDHYSERYTGTADNGGVHINSGIVNKQFYLLAHGGTHHLGGEMTGIGTNAAAAIWYHALTNYMTSDTDFAGARIATINASNSLYGVGSVESDAVAQAWSLVGVS